MNHSNGIGDENPTFSDSSSESQALKIPTAVPTSNSRMPSHSGLNPGLTFDRFVVGQSNRQAYEAAIGMSAPAGWVYNPLIVYGGVGLGKTHLLHAIGNQFRKRHLNRTVYCLSSEKFVHEWIQSIAHPQKFYALRHRYHNTDLLLLDDIHFLSQETKIQEEFFHLLNRLNLQDQRLVCTCDRLPRFLEDFWSASHVPQKSLIVEICPPEFELRVSILEQKLRERNWGPVPLKVLHYLAKHLTEHIRQLEGALNRLMAEVRLGSTLTLQSARRVIEGKAPDLSPSCHITLEAIQEVVARYFHLTLSDLCSHKRERRFVLPRQVGMYLARQLTSLSLSQIGHGFGQSHRTTVIRSCQRVESLLTADLVLSQSIEALKAELIRVKN